MFVKYRLIVYYVCFVLSRSSSIFVNYYIQLYHYCSLKVDILICVNISGRNQTATSFAPSGSVQISGRNQTAELVAPHSEKKACGRPDC